MSLLKSRLVDVAASRLEIRSRSKWRRESSSTAGSSLPLKLGVHRREGGGVHDVKGGGHRGFAGDVRGKALGCWVAIAPLHLTWRWQLSTAPVTHLPSTATFLSRGSCDNTLSNLKSPNGSLSTYGLLGEAILTSIWVGSLKGGHPRVDAFAWRQEIGVPQRSSVLFEVNLTVLCAQQRKEGRSIVLVHAKCASGGMQLHRAHVPTLRRWTVP